MSIPEVNEAVHIPDEWHLVPLKYVVNYNENTLPENSPLNFEFEYVDISSVEYGKGIKCFQKMQFCNAPSRARRIVVENDIVLSTVRTYLKAVASIPKRDLPVIASTGFLAMTAKNNILPRYLFYAVQSERFVENVEANSYGISYPAINTSSAVAIKILLPPLPEQQAIADYLDDRCSKIDEIIAEATASIEEYKKLKQAVIYEAVTKGIDKDAPMKDSGVEWIGEIPRDWHCVRIKYLLSEKNTRSETGEEESLSVSQVLGVVPSSMIAVANPSSSTIGQKIVEPNDLVFNKLKAHLGVFFMSEYKGLVSPDYAVYRANKTVNPKYLEYLFHTPACITEFKKYITGVAAGLMRLYTNDLFNIYISLPTITEQNQIVNYLNKKVHMFDSLITEKQSLIEDLQAYKKSLIYEVVTGKRRVV